MQTNDPFIRFLSIRTGSRQMAPLPGTRGVLDYPAEIRPRRISRLPARPRRHKANLKQRALGAGSSNSTVPPSPPLLADRGQIPLTRDMENYRRPALEGLETPISSDCVDAAGTNPCAPSQGRHRMGHRIVPESSCRLRRTFEN